MSPPREILNFSISELRFAAFSAFSVLIRRKFWLYIYIFFNCYILATKSFLRGSDDRLCKIKMIGEIRQNFTEASASVGLILATALYFMPIAFPPSPVPVTSEEWCQLGSESLTFLRLNWLLLFKCWIVLSTRPGLFKRWIALPTG